MFLSKQPNGTWYIFYNQENGKRTCRSTGSKYKKDALKFLNDFQKVYETNKQNKYTPITLKKYIWEFLKYTESVYSPNSIMNFKSSFKYFIKFTGDINLDSVTEKLLLQYFDQRIKNSSVYQARKDRINLSSLFSKAIKDGFLLENPIKGIKQFKIPEKQPTYYSKDEFRILLETIKEDDIKDLVIVAVNTGLRQMELLTLEWNQINFEQSYVILDNRNHLTKSKRVRTVPLNTNALDILKKRYNNEVGKVFTIEGNPITQDSISNRFTRIKKKSGLNRKLNFHSLRHTFASWLIQKGVPIYNVSKLLGHSSIKTTEIYAHLRMDDLQSVVNKLDI